MSAPLTDGEMLSMTATVLYKRNMKQDANGFKDLSLVWLGSLHSGGTGNRPRRLAF